ncbi:phosphoglycerate dehydrogenase-like enzyme [Deinobacterium chartae]|uniref:Phosphoglycerate dehydrogenase-like enzyme n=1 Tax=Deinobacterium chartae TaxID=521158 RepID=A0A841HXG8_9DEIO|nr:D-2-hydroxyacid dehydrogenase [Deinobacterium chartae]MBB6098097.1 phosphoglycerate dehydrogenase-like enzyme [Deinobacterium chartae]
MPSATVLLSHLYETHDTAPLFARFPEVRFVQLEKDAHLPARAAEADAILCGGMGKPQLSRLLRAAPRLEWIHTGSAGFDWVMVPEVTERAITVSRSAAVMNTPMAEFALGVMLAHAKNLDAMREAQTRHAWEPPMHRELYGATVGVVGAGAIGARIARLARAFGMRTLATKREAAPLEDFDAVYPPEGLEVLLAESDYLILTCPLTPETRHMIGRAQLARMKPGAYLINLARGGLIVEAELLRALQDGTLAGACLDAFEVEPLPADSPLWDAPNLRLTPHCSYRSPAIRARVVEEFAANLERYLRGEPLHNTLRHAALGY